MPADINQFVSWVWMLVFLFWAVSAISSRRDASRQSGTASGHSTNLLAWIAWWLLLSHGFGQPSLRVPFIPMTLATTYFGGALALAGLGFALWARLVIGRNWSAVVVVKEDHHLIRTGPYAVVRHPIYTGFMSATLGTAILYNEISGLLAFALIVLGWGYKAKIEEQLMAEQFGAEYDQYRQEVKGLIPYVW